MLKTTILLAAVGSALMVGQASAQAPASRAAQQASSANLPTQAAQRPAEPTGEGYTIWRNALFRNDDRERLRDGRAEAAIEAARQNVEAFQRQRQRYDLDNADLVTARVNRGALALEQGRLNRESFAQARARAGLPPVTSRR